MGVSRDYAVQVTSSRLPGASEPMTRRCRIFQSDPLPRPPQADIAFRYTRYAFSSFSCRSLGAFPNMETDRKQSQGKTSLIASDLTAVHISPAQLLPKTSCLRNKIIKRRFSRSSVSIIFIFFTSLGRFCIALGPPVSFRQPSRAPRGIHTYTGMHTTCISHYSRFARLNSQP